MRGKLIAIVAGVLLVSAAALFTFSKPKAKTSGVANTVTTTNDMKLVQIDHSDIARAFAAQAAAFVQEATNTLPRANKTNEIQILSPPPNTITNNSQRLIIAASSEYDRKMVMDFLSYPANTNARKPGSPRS